MNRAANERRLSRRGHAAVWVLTAMAVAALAVVYGVFQDANVWASWTPAEELYRGLYAEPIHLDSIFRTPLNTWSNVAFLVVGLYICALGVTDWRTGSRRNFLESHPSVSVAYGLACVGLAFGSIFFHASLTRWGQHIDVGMMYAPPLVLVAFNSARYAGRRARRVHWFETCIALGIAVWLMLFIFKWSLSSFAVVSAMAAAILAFAVADALNKRIETRMRYLYLAAAAIAAGMAFQGLDVLRILPEGHALWHLCGAAALWWVYGYHRSESPVSAGISDFAESAYSVQLEPGPIHEAG